MVCLKYGSLALKWGFREDMQILIHGLIGCEKMLETDNVHTANYQDVKVVEVFICHCFIVKVFRFSTNRTHQVQDILVLYRYGDKRVHTFPTNTILTV